MEIESRPKPDFSGESSLNISYYKEVDMSNGKIMDFII